jgi:lipopolysaccharide export system protein LptA
MKIALLAVLGLFLLPACALAQEAPLEITASKNIEWDRNAKTYSANGDVVAARGNARIKSDTLTAFYTEAGGEADVTRLAARGNVEISSAPYTAHGDEGTYDVKTGDAALAGKDLRIVSGAEYLTARDKIVFSGTENKLTAFGAATAHKDGRTLTSDSLTAWFEKDAQGEMTATRITAGGTVVIKTEKETVTGDTGVYDVKTQTAELSGAVRIVADGGVLEGTRATVDMKTGISRLFAGDSVNTQGRVRGVFYPKKKVSVP